MELFDRDKGEDMSFDPKLIGFKSIYILISHTITSFKYATKGCKRGKPEGNHLFLKHKLSFPEPQVGLQKENSCSLRFVTMIWKDRDMQTKIDAVYLKLLKKAEIKREHVSPWFIAITSLLVRSSKVSVVMFLTSQPTKRGACAVLCLWKEKKVKLM